MKIANTPLKKTILIVFGAILSAAVVIILLISPIAKYLLEKYAEKYTGRQVKMSWIYINPFTGYVHISNLKIYESKSLPGYRTGDSIFFTARGVSVNFALLKLLSKTVEITEATLDQPHGIIIQNKKVLNFTDLIKLFTPKKPSTTPSSVHFSILKISLKNGVFRYREDVTPIDYFIKEVNIESAGKRWNADTMGVHFSFTSGTGTGRAKGNFTINYETLDYHYSVVVQKFDLSIIEQYLREITNHGSFSANIDADMKAKGNFKDEENITMSGQLAVNDFHFGKNPKEDLSSFKKLSLAIIEISPKNHQYLFDSVSLVKPYFIYEIYDYLDNLQRMFGKNGANISSAAADPAKFNLVIEIARYVKVLARNFFQSEYKIDRLAIYDGNLQFNDYSVKEKFSASAYPLYIVADSVDKNHKWVNVAFKSGIKPYGDLNVTLRINPTDSTDFDLQYDLKRVPASVFNPYLITYTSFPLDRGTIEIKGSWNVRNGIIQSKNHLVVIDPRIGIRSANKNTKWLPMRLMMSLVRERGNVIDYEIPITGNLKDPKFHLHDVLVDIVENIFVKPATGPYRMEVKDLEAEIEQSLTLKWNMRQNSLLPQQEKFIDEMVDFLKDNPDASISVYPMVYAEKEKEYIGFFEAKKKYFLRNREKKSLQFSEADSIDVDNKSVKDSLFVRYLNKYLDDSLLFTIQEKCNRYIGIITISNTFRLLNKERETAFLHSFTQKGVENRVKFHSPENTIPYNGFSFYKIVYKGDFPKSLLKAYRKMNELNNEKPRKKFRKERKESISISK